jgi:hypothetical protein
MKYADGSEERTSEWMLDAAASRSIFERAGEIIQITVILKDCRS